MNEKTKLYLQGTITLLVITLILFGGLNYLLPIPYTFRFFEVFGVIMLIILSVLGSRPKYLKDNLNENSNKN